MTTETGDTIVVKALANCEDRLTDTEGAVTAADAAPIFPFSITPFPLSSSTSSSLSLKLKEGDTMCTPKAKDSTIVERFFVFNLYPVDPVLLLKLLLSVLIGKMS